MVPILLTLDELESEVRYLREQNKKTLSELSKVIEENAALREQLLVQGLAVGSRQENAEELVRVDEEKRNRLP